MGSPYCDLLRSSPDLRYAFSCDLRRSNSSNYSSSKRIDGELRLKATKKSVHIARIIYDTGASLSAVPINYVADLLGFSNADAWSYLGANCQAVPLTSLVASALIQNVRTSISNTESQTSNDGGTLGYALPIFLSFGAFKNKALLLNAVVVNVSANYMLLSPLDAERAFVVLVDSGTALAHLNLPTRIRFFEHAHSDLKSLDAWRIAETAGFAIPAPKLSSKARNTRASSGND